MHLLAASMVLNASFACALYTERHAADRSAAWADARLVQLRECDAQNTSLLGAVDGPREWKHIDSVPQLREPAAPSTPKLVRDPIFGH